MCPSSLGATIESLRSKKMSRGDLNFILPVLHSTVVVPVYTMMVMRRCIYVTAVNGLVIQAH